MWYGRVIKFALLIAGGGRDRRPRWGRGVGTLVWFIYITVKIRKNNVLQYNMFPNILKKYFKSSLLPASIFNQTVKDLKVFWRKTNSLKCWGVSLSLLTVIIVPAALNSRSLLACVAGIANSFAATLATQGYFFRLASTNQRD